MHLKELKIEGFGAFEEPAAFELKPGFNAVTGPAGRGKTSLLAAVAWCLGRRGRSDLADTTDDVSGFTDKGSSGESGGSAVTAVVDNLARPGSNSATVERRLGPDGEETVTIDGQVAERGELERLLSGGGRPWTRLSERDAAKPLGILSSISGLSWYRSTREELAEKLGGRCVELALEIARVSGASAAMGPPESASFSLSSESSRRMTEGRRTLSRLAARQAALEESVSGSIDRLERLDRRIAERLPYEVMRINRELPKAAEILLPGMVIRASASVPDPVSLSSISLEVERADGKQVARELESAGRRASISMAVLLAAVASRPRHILMLDHLDGILDDEARGRMAQAIRAMSGASQVIAATHGGPLADGADRVIEL